MATTSTIDYQTVCTVYYARPGNSADNVNGRWSGPDQTPLSEDGVKAAEKMAKEFSGVVFDQVYCSKAQRTIQTAQIIAQSIVPRPLECLYEMQIGPLEQMDPSEIALYFKQTTGYPSETSKAALPKLWERKKGEDPTANECLLDRGWHPQIDNFDDFCEKIRPELLALFKENIGKTILLVGHGTPGKYILSLAKKVAVIDVENKKGAYFKVVINQSGDVFL